MNTYVIYHGGGCRDGFAAAWSAYKKLGNTATYIAWNHGETPEFIFNKYNVQFNEGDLIYFLDFSLPKEIIEDWNNKYNLVILDHHISAKRALDGLNENFVFNIDFSGAVLSWLYFHKNENIPWFIQYIQDHDLWRFQLHMSKEVGAFIYSLPLHYEIYDGLALYEFPDNSILESGRLVLEYKEREIEKLIEHKEEVEINGIKAYVVNYCGNNISDLGNRLCDKDHVSISWYISNKKVIYSFRSVDENSCDVSQLASKYGGGGHRNASGLSLPLEMVPQELKFWEIQKEIIENAETEEKGRTRFDGRNRNRTDAKPRTSRRITA